MSEFHLHVPGRLEGSWIRIDGRRVCREDLQGIYTLLALYLNEESGWPTEEELRQMWRCRKCGAVVDEAATVPVFEHKDWKGCPKCGYQCAPIQRREEQTCTP